MDEQYPDNGQHLLVDVLYGELSDESRERAEAEIQGLAKELDEFADLRALLQTLPETEPPQAVTAKLMHAAALHVPAKKTSPWTGNSESSSSWWAWLSRLFRPVVMHPALAAAATLVLMVTVAGTIYMSGTRQFAEPELPVNSRDTAANQAERLEPPVAPAPPASETTALEGDFSGALESAADDPADVLALPQGTASGADTSKRELERGPSLRRSKSKRPRAQKQDYMGDSRSVDLYEGESIVPAGGGRAGAAQSSSSGIGGVVPSMPRKADNAPQPDPTPAAPEAADQDDEAAPKEAQKKESSSAPADKAAGDVPSPRDAGTRARIRSLHDEAKAAANTGDCDTVAEAGAVIRKLDADYYRESFRKDKALASCFTGKAR